MDTPSPKSIDRVGLACKQCRTRHVKCDATQPVCDRCRRDGKECVYQKSRRGGLDRAALARRRERLAAEAAQREAGSYQTSASSPSDGQSVDHQTCSLVNSVDASLSTLQFLDQNAASTQMSFQVSEERLLDIFYENYWPGCPVTLPLNQLNQRRLTANHGMQNLLPVMHWLGSVFAPWAIADSHYEIARKAMESPSLPRTPWSVQALLLYAGAQRHCNRTPEAQRMIDIAVGIALELRMNTKEFAVAFGEGDPFLEESWRRTYCFLALHEQQFAIMASNPNFTTINIPNLVDLPCEDEDYILGNIPVPATWEQYDTREFDEVQVVYSSITYLLDVARFCTFVIVSFKSAGTFNPSFVWKVDAKIAAWRSLLPATKKDAMRPDGSVDEIMFLAHMIATVLTKASHRPFSSLPYSFEECTTTSFAPAVPFMEAPKDGRAVHTARTVRACDMQTKFLSIPCAVERHSVFTLAIVATIATTQIAACKLLDDCGLDIARDRVRLSIGFLNAMGAYWPTAKAMAKDVRFVARGALSGHSKSITPRSEASAPGPAPGPALGPALGPATGPATRPVPGPAIGPAHAETELARDELIWPVDPSAHIDIYAGITLPLDLDMQMMNYASSSTSSL